MALSYLDAEYDIAMHLLRTNVPNSYQAMNCFLSGMCQEEGAKYMSITKSQYKEYLKYARRCLRQYFSSKKIAPSLLMDGRVLDVELSAKLHFMFPEEP